MAKNKVKKSKNKYDVENIEKVIMSDAKKAVENLNKAFESKGNKKSVKKVEKGVEHATKEAVKKLNEIVSEVVGAAKQTFEGKPQHKQHKHPVETKSQPQNNIPQVNQNLNFVSFKEFSRIDMKVGKILDAKDHPDADKLLILTVDLGEGKKRTVVAGLKQFYKKEDLRGKKAVFVTNLAPITLRGVQSEAMILAAVTKNDAEVTIIQPQKDVKEGTKVQ